MDNFMDPVIIDIRETDEYCMEHIDGSINLPLSELRYKAPGVVRQLKPRPLTLMCLSGKRSQMAKSELCKLGLASEEELSIFDGGIQRWKKEGKETVSHGKKKKLTLMRQNLLAAGLLVLLSAGLTEFVHSQFVFMTVAIGVGLFVAGASGFCLMGQILSKMPWNR